MKEKLLWLFILIVLMFYYFSTKEHSIPVYGESMYPTIKNGDTISYKTYYLGDLPKNSIVLFETKDGDLNIKRVIGVAGDKVIIRDNDIFLNDELFFDSKISPGDTYISNKEILIKEDEIFVLGDNLSKSVDSRNYGCVKLSNVIGIYTGKVWGKVTLN